MKISLKTIVTSTLLLHLNLHSMSSGTISPFSHLLQTRWNQFTLQDTKLNLSPINNAHVIAMFCDIKNILNISAQSEPFGLCLLTKFYLESIFEIIKKHSGMVNKFTTRSVFAVFPIQSEETYTEVLKCSMAILSFSNNLNSDNTASIDCSIGIACGQVAQGFLGGPGFYEETYIGDVINSASRLQVLCSALKTKLAVTEQFFFKIPRSNQVLFEQFSTQWVKGKTDCIRVFGLTTSFFYTEDLHITHKINKQKIAQRLQPEVIEELQCLKQKKYVSLFCDIRNFTSYCEENSSNPAFILKFLQIYLSELTSIIFKYKGFPSKYLGDGILVLFPVESSIYAEQACTNAVRCAEEFIKVAENYTLKNGVGISYGNSIPMDVGVRPTLKYNQLCNNIVIGSSVRACIWLEDLNKIRKLQKNSIKPIIISSDVFFNLAEDYKKCFRSVNPPKSNLTVYCYAREKTIHFPPIRNKTNKEFIFKEDFTITNSNFSTDPEIDQMISAESAAAEY